MLILNNIILYLLGYIRSLIFQLRQQAQYLLSQLFIIRVHLLSVRVERRRILQQKENFKRLKRNNYIMIILSVELSLLDTSFNYSLIFLAGNKNSFPKKVFSTSTVTEGRHYSVSYLAGLVLVDSVVIALIARAAPVLEALNLLDQTGNAHSALACFILIRTI